MYFSFFKPQDWRKRSVVHGRGFIQRFLSFLICSYTDGMTSVPNRPASQ